MGMKCSSGRDFKPGDKVITRNGDKAVVVQVVGGRMVVVEYPGSGRYEHDEFAFIPAHGEIEREADNE